jgi:hypothetical protein
MNNKHTYHICHYCVEYKTRFNRDMHKHFYRKNRCDCNTLLSYEESKLLTLHKKYVFLFDPVNLIKDDYLFIINNYNDQINYIYPNFKLIKTNELVLNNKKIEELTDKNMEDLNNNLISTNENNNIHKSDEKVDEIDELYFNKDKNKYICNICLSEYTSKQNMKHHLMNEKKCLQKLQLKKLINKRKEYSKQLLNNELEINNLYVSHTNNSKNNSTNIQVQNNLNNVNNIQNINNNNNNTHNSTYHLSVNDFVNDRYDLTHIKDSFYEQKDFFVYPNLLNMIMQNKKNHNLFFANGEAVFYSDNELNKMSSDKAGYLILDKLSQSFDELIYKQDEEAREYFKFISKYYYVLKGHYKHDTIFKDYDVDARQFFYTSQGNLFRSRDKYLTKIIGTVNKFSDEVRTQMNIDGLDIKNIPLINPNIEDFASVRMRYRDLKDKD